jgi:hypothetical protein
MNWGVFAEASPGLSGRASRNKVSSQEVKLLALTGTSSARSLTVSRESFEVTVSGGSTFARVKLKEIDGMAPQDVERAV